MKTVKIWLIEGYCDGKTRISMQFISVTMTQIIRSFFTKIIMCLSSICCLQLKFSRRQCRKKINVRLWWIPKWSSSHNIFSKDVFCVKRPHVSKYKMHPQHLVPDTRIAWSMIFITQMILIKSTHFMIMRS